MDLQFIDEIVAPKSLKALQAKITNKNDKDVVEGSIESGDEKYLIDNGLPSFIDNLSKGECKVQELFSKYWTTFDLDNMVALKKDLYVDSLKKLLLVDNLDNAAAQTTINAYLNSKNKILDAGCGVGWICRLFRANDQQKWYNVDMSDAILVAHKNLRTHPNNFTARASIGSLPFKKQYFDLIFCNGVIHHTPNPKEMFTNLVSHLAPGGDICIAMIRRQAPMRDFADQHIRQFYDGLSFEETMQISKSFFEFSKELAQHDVTINVPAGLEKVLGVEAKSYKLKNLIHTYFVKCFYSPHFSDEENILQQMDWYQAKYAWPFTEEELIDWYKEAGLENIKVWEPKFSEEKHELIRIRGTKKK